MIPPNDAVSSGTRVSSLAICVFLGMPLVLALNARFGFDRMTTLNWTTPVTLGAALCVGSLVAYLATKNPLFRTPGASSAGKDPGREIASLGLARIAYVVVIALVAGYITGKLLGALAPYTPGSERMLDATVVHIVEGNSPRNPCLRRMTAWTRDGTSPSEFCLSKSVGGSIGSDSLTEGQQVKLTVRTTILGEAVMAVERAGP